MMRRARRFLAAILFAAAGCAEEPQIVEYDSPAIEPRREPPAVEEVAATLDHMFAAIVPAGERAWFFKLVAPATAAADLREPIREFLATVDASGLGDKPSWTLPAGWTENAGDAMRAATIEIPSGDKTLELTVSSLPNQGEWEMFVEGNVNRWLGQLDQAPLPRATILKLAQGAPTRAGEATLFELVGVMRLSPGMMPAGHPEVARGTPSAAAEAAAPAPLEYALPAGWSRGPANPMRKATFAVEAGGERGEVAVTAFPAFGAMAEPLENARRWASGVGAPADDAALEAAIESLEIGGQPADFMEFAAPGDDASADAVAAAMVRRGDEVWFFKFSGPRSLIASQRVAFRELLASVKFNE